MTAHVRLRRNSDLDACVRILADVHAGDRYPLHWPADPAAWITPDGLLGAWVAELDGEVAGHAVLSPGEKAGTCEVNRLYVSPAARGHRIGELLMARLTGAARESGLRPLLDVVTTNTTAIALYERLGWTRTATVHAYWTPDPAVMMHQYRGPA
ncbi:MULTISPECIES: GNAT family N-acetyltransferase [unclassified Streptomyces]|uniref:GNAT family N-acetyltransferase n=1 Tax=unclassified Streptomyces TaxID=2593676 RepID=UPI002E1B45D7|nr:GNAT family N-acetyltransferase [Streptomyces sp. NBC_01023]